MPLLQNKEEILKAAIEKAVKNGWNAFGCYGAFMGTPPTWEVRLPYPNHPIIYRINEMFGGETRIDPKEFIFSHDFARAFWGIGDHRDCSTDNCWHSCDDGVSAWDGHNQERWQYHLQQMVLEEDPIQYLAKFL